MHMIRMVPPLLHFEKEKTLFAGLYIIWIISQKQQQQRLGYVRNPHSPMEGTEMLCRDDIGIYLGAPIISDLRENANGIG